MTSKNWAKFRSLFAVLEHFARIFWAKNLPSSNLPRWFFSAVISQCVSSTANSCSWSNRSFCCVRQSFFFFVGNSRLNYRITESIFDTTLFTLTLTRLFTRTYACSAMLLMAAADSCHKNSLLRISLSRIFEKDRDFFASNPTKNRSKIRWLFVENSRERRTNFDELRLHFAILRCLFWHASDTQHATLNKRFGVSQCAQQKPPWHLLCYSLNMRIWRVVCHAQHAVSCTRARVITFLLVFPWMVTFGKMEYKEAMETAGLQSLWPEEKMHAWSSTK